MAFDLKQESDVKEYLENLGTEYRFGCFSEKRPEVCHLLADFLEAIKKDFEKASKVYRSNCDDYKYGKSCLKYGHYSFLGKGRASEKGDAKQVRMVICSTRDPIIPEFCPFRRTNTTKKAVSLVTLTPVFTLDCYSSPRIVQPRSTVTSQRLLRISQKAVR